MYIKGHNPRCPCCAASMTRCGPMSSSHKAKLQKTFFKFLKEAFAEQKTPCEHREVMPNSLPRTKTTAQDHTKGKSALQGKKNQTGLRGAEKPSIDAAEKNNELCTALSPKTAAHPEPNPIKSHPPLAKMQNDFRARYWQATEVNDEKRRFAETVQNSLLALGNALDTFDKVFACTLAMED